ncbi:MAG: hypothetical protein IJC52_02260 [Clostridia bacterium]|nr:hypothetical protein [Clostridia bacterium]
MKFCQKCGKELMDEAVICTGCGCSVAPSTTSAVTTQEKKPITKQFALLALVLGILMPIVGIAMGIYGYVKADDADVKKKCMQAITISFAVWCICAGIIIACTA